MRILYDYQVFSWQTYGGISRYFFELIIRLARLPENAVSVFMGMHVNRYGLERFRSQFQAFYGHEHRLSPMLSRAIRLLNPPMFTEFAKRQPTDLYHQTYYASPAAPRAGKVVLTVYDMTHELLPECFPARDRTRRRKQLAVSRADGIICISENTKRDLMAILDVPEAKIAVIPLANSLRCEAGETPVVTTPYVLFVGQRGGYKNFTRFAEAFASRPALARNFKLVCFGGGAFTPAEEALLRGLRIRDAAATLDGPDSLLANLYRHAGAFVYPSRYEGFGFPPLEAMHYGCPVLVSRNSSIPEVVGDAGCYVDPEDREDMAFQLEQLLGNESLRAHLGAKGREREAQFSWERCATETQRFYRHVLDR
jgi:glycosyltransferase involved in cell wall biosynthesis